MPLPAHPIAPVPAGPAAFIGSAGKGPLNRPVPVTSFDGFQQRFGSLVSDLYLGYAIRQFFVNGGTHAIAIRIARKPTRAKVLAGLRALDAIDRFALLALPGMATPAIIADAADYCRQRRAFLIVDPPADARTPAGIEAFARKSTLPKTPDAALYYPWTKVSDPLAGGHPRSIPPSGTLAGVIARTDATLGVWKSPAGPSANLLGVKTLDYLLTDAESAPLNTRAINTLRTFPTFGNVAWGARTLAGDDTLASEWKYIAIRRLALFIAESVDRGTRWVLFEPDTEPLRTQLRSDVEAFLHTLFQQGAFAGRTPRDAFFVKCDRQAGIVNIEVGFAPLRPAEFVVISIRHPRN